MSDLISLFTQLPETLLAWVRDYGGWTYGILFVIVFVETGVVVMPFLPGDSLLFAAGAIAKAGGLDFWALCGVIIAAAILGDAANYHLGKLLGPKLAAGKRFRLINERHLERTKRFFERHGGKAIVLARFVPIVRTFAPFVAGIGVMRYPRFLVYNAVGAVAWTAVCVGAGWLFGSIPAVQKNFELVIIAIVVVSVLPLLFEWWRARRTVGQSPISPGENCATRD